MFCKFCGNELAEDAKFCTKCGKIASDKEATAVSEPAPASVELEDATYEPPTDPERNERGGSRVGRHPLESAG